jgi:hypothetical protein
LDPVQNSLSISLKLFKTSPLASTKDLFDGIEEIELFRCDIREIGRMRHFSELFKRNSAIVFELWSLALYILRKNLFCHGIPIGDSSNSIMKVFVIG